MLRWTYLVLYQTLSLQMYWPSCHLNRLLLLALILVRPLWLHHRQLRCFDDPFGDGPFRAVPSSDGFSAQQSTSTFTVAATDVFSAQRSKSAFTEPPQTVAQTTVNDMGFGDGFDQTVDILAAKTNPLSDIGIDFEAINRKEKRMEKPSKTPATSNVTMGKAMGSGYGIGRAGASALRPASNPMGIGMGMGAGPGFGGGYGGLNQPMGMNNMPQNMGMGMNNMPQNMGMGMNNGQGFQMQAPPATGFMPPGNYNPVMGRGGGYGQQPYGGYR
ncbi:hypothetical protein HanPI659440_Chr02g0091781 [Helianthus annuus]|nr:hypothetical protein HanPI659440_Chr02g0091781 [Helianthus annuus]